MSKIFVSNTRAPHCDPRSDSGCTRPWQVTKVLIYICHAFKINLGRIRSESTSESYLLHADWKLKRDARIQDARTCPLVNARARNSRDILQLLRNPLRRTEIAACTVPVYTYTRKSAQTEIRETTRSSCRVIRSSRRPFAVS